MTDYLYSDITSAILAGYYRVFHVPSSHGLTEDSLTNALLIELKKRGLHIRQQVPVAHRYDDRTIGVGRIDLLVEGKVVVDLKKLDTLRSKDTAQLKAYLFDGEYAVGLLLNFGSKSPQIRRIYNSRHAPGPGDQAEAGSGGGR